MLRNEEKMLKLGIDVYGFHWKQLDNSYDIPDERINLTEGVFILTFFWNVGKIMRKYKLTN